MKYVCPSCGTLNEEGAASCMGCGMALGTDEAQRKEQIERRLRGDIPVPENPTVIRLGAVSGNDPARPEPETPPDMAAEGKATIPRRKIRRRWFLLGGITLLLIVAVAVWGAFLFRGEYHSSPERVLDGLEHAVNTQDFDLFYKLVDWPENTSKENITAPLWVETKYRADFQVIDILEGSRHKMALMFLRCSMQPDNGDLSDRPADSEYQETFVQFVKEDGEWKLSSNFGGLYFLLYDEYTG